MVNKSLVEFSCLRKHTKGCFMSKIVNFGTLCGGVGGLIAGVLAAVQFLSGPQKIDDTDDLANSIIELANAVSLSNVTVEVS